ncbi:MAG: rhomboid family intramembrane serine protease [Candidatus Methanofastidiosia archaeon]
MLPLHDDVPTRGTPLVTYVFLLANILIFLYETFLDFTGDLESFFYAYAIIPANIVQGKDLYTLITAMFMHGGVMHIAGNMLYLYIFGNNVEESMGHFKFVVFYLVCGLSASFLQIYIDPHSNIPNLGASGAIAGVLGAYLILHPRAKVQTLIFFGFFIRTIQVPAFVLLGFWFILQLFSGIGSLGYTGGGVAYFAHVGGFVAGFILIFFFRKRRRVRRMAEEEFWDELLYKR